MYKHLVKLIGGLIFIISLCFNSCYNEKPSLVGYWKQVDKNYFIEFVDNNTLIVQNRDTVNYIINKDTFILTTKDNFKQKTIFQNYGDSIVFSRRSLFEYRETYIRVNKSDYE